MLWNTNKNNILDIYCHGGSIYVEMLEVSINVCQTLWINNEVCRVKNSCKLMLFCYMATYLSNTRLLIKECWVIKKYKTIK